MLAKQDEDRERGSRAAALGSWVPLEQAVSRLADLLRVARPEHRRWLVSRAANGQPWGKYALDRASKRAIGRAGIAGSWRFHVLRHFFVTQRCGCHRGLMPDVRWWRWGDRRALGRPAQSRLGQCVLHPHCLRCLRCSRCSRCLRCLRSAAQTVSGLPASSVSSVSTVSTVSRNRRRCLLRNS